MCLNICHSGKDTKHFSSQNQGLHQQDHLQHFEQTLEAFCLLKRVKTQGQMSMLNETVIDGLAMVSIKRK